VVVCGDFNSAKLLKVEEVDWIADDPDLRVYHQKVFGPRCCTAHRMSVGRVDSSLISSFGVRMHPQADGRTS
jgi:hypothetical protein